MTPLAGQPADAAIPALLKQHGAMLYSLVLRICGNAADADDALQETFLSAYRHWGKFQGRSDPRTWLYTIAVRACRRRQRREGRRRSRTVSLDALAPMDGTPIADPRARDGGPAEAPLRAEAVRTMEAEIARLPETFRVPLILKDVLELPVADVAAALAIKPATVKTRVHRARLMLRAALDESLPRRDLPPAMYERQVCFDLLRAKQEALDSGRAFPVRNEVMCERCRAVFAGMDLALDACRELAADRLPPALRDAILSRLGDGGSPSAAQKRRKPRRAGG